MLDARLRKLILENRRRLGQCPRFEDKDCEPCSQDQRSDNDGLAPFPDRRVTTTTMPVTDK